MFVTSQIGKGNWKTITGRSRNLAHDRRRKIGLAAEYVEAVLTATAWRPSAALPKVGHAWFGIPPSPVVMPMA
jgi:hypothetical protein